MILKLNHKYQFRFPLDLHPFIEILRGSVLEVTSIDEISTDWISIKVVWGLIKETTGDSFDIPERFWQYFSELSLQED